MDAPLSTAPEERLRVGSVVLDHYQVDGVLGEGGTGVVYSARDESNGADVALKVMHPHLASERQVRGRFAREAAILKRLEGPHVCRILGSGEVDNPSGGESLLCLVLPRIFGRSLDAVLADGPLDEARAVVLAKEVLEALESAHGHDVIHRDLKPHNVLVDREGHATVVDFGLSKLLNDAGGTGTTNLTAHNMVFGTPEYMSPEQARGDELDARCDLYACGVMLFEMLTGKLPFQGRTPLAVLTAHLTDAPPSPAEVAPERKLSPAVTAVVLRALSKDPKNRYPTAGAMRGALERAEIFPDEPDEIPERIARGEGETEEHGVPTPAVTTRSGITAVTRDAPRETLERESATAETSESHVELVEPAPETKRTAELPARSTPEPRAGSTEISLTPKPPSSRRLPPSGDPNRNDTGSRGRSSKAPVSRREAPTRDLRWPLAWVIVVGASIAIGVFFGLRS